MENWKNFLNEAPFYNSPDEDKPGNKQVILFSPEFKYTKEGSTHGKMSHMIKHYLEFDNPAVKKGLETALNVARSFENFYLFHALRGELIAQGQIAKKKATANAMLNTFDVINDKILTSEQLKSEEEMLLPIIRDLVDSYDALVDSYLDTAIDTDGTEDSQEIMALLNSGQIIKFTGVYKGKKKDYFFNPSNTGLAAVDGRKVATLFRIDKSGNNMEKVKKYFSRGVTVSNPALRQALGIE
jgi:hypothetical protein